MLFIINHPDNDEITEADFTVEAARPGNYPLDIPVQQR
jgi:hypothetical protein